MDQSEVRRVEMPLQLREAPINSIDKATRTAVVEWTRGAGVRRYDWMRDRFYQEQLSLADGAIRMGRLDSGSAPLLDSHNQWDLRGVIGVIERAYTESGKRLASVRFSARDEVKPLFQDVQDGIIRNVSVGYIVHRIEMQAPLKDGEDWIYRVVDWEPVELSLVPIGADPGAGVRTAKPADDVPKFSCEFITPAAAAGSSSTSQRNQETPMTETVKPAVPAADPNAGSKEQEKSLELRAQEATKAERERILGIQARAQKAGMSAEDTEKLVSEGLSLEASCVRLVDLLAAKKPAPQGAAVIDVVRDETVAERGAIVAALMHRADPSLKLDDQSKQFAGYTLRELARERLEAKGIRTRGMSIVEICNRTFESGSDLPNIVLDAANKSLRQAYDAAPRTHEMWARQSTAPDFKNINRVVLSGAPSLLKVLPGEEIKRGAVTDGKETYQLATYARILGINRATIINDDMQAFTRLPALAARSASDLEADTVYSILTTNANLADGVALFATATHVNLSSSSDAISVTSLGAGRGAMRVQKGLEGRPINVSPRFLLVPVAKETLAEQYTSADFVSAKSSDINPFRGGKPSALTVVAEPRLDANSATAWYLAADPSQIDTVEYAYLEGQPGVYLESRMGWDIDGMELKVRLDFAAKALDYRGLWKNPGA
jgi:hypothetical protein